MSDLARVNTSFTGSMITPPTKIGDDPTRTDAVLENVSLMPGLWRNFKGEERKFTAEGMRSFNIKFWGEDVEAMRQDGWNMKDLQPDESGIPAARLQIKVNYKFRPPNVVVINSAGQHHYGPEIVGLLDDMDIEYADVSWSGRWHDMNGGGWACYLKSLYVVMREDKLAQKWNSIAAVRTAEVNGTVALPPSNVTIVDGEWQETQFVTDAPY